MNEQIEYYDGDTLHEGDVDPADYTMHLCEVGDSEFGVLNGTHCPNHRFGCPFEAE